MVVPLPRSPEIQMTDAHEITQCGTAVEFTYTNYHGPLRSCQVIRESTSATQIPENEVCPAAHGCRLCSPGNRASASRPPGCTSSREHIHGVQEHHAAPVSQDPAVGT